MLQRLHHVDGTCVEFLQRKMRSDNTSGYTGVRRAANGQWVATITFKKKRYELGTYETLMEAVAARKAGERMHTEFLKSYYEEHPEQIGEYIRRRMQDAGQEELQLGNGCNDPFGTVSP